jgi:hypothetical protein
MLFWDSTLRNNIRSCLKVSLRIKRFFLKDRNIVYKSNIR